MVGRFSRNAGPTGVHFDKQNNKYFSYQDPITGADKAYYTDSDGARVYSEGSQNYVWKSEPYTGEKWVPITVNGKTRFRRDFGVLGYRYYFTFASNSGSVFYEEGSLLSYGYGFARDLQSHFETGGGGDYVISRERLQHMFHQALENGAFNWQDAKHLGDNKYAVPTDFYKTSYYLSFGTATMKIFMDLSTGVVYPTGFSDGWNLDTKPWGIRSYPAEMLTRYYNWKLTGNNFNIRYP